MMTTKLTSQIDGKLKKTIFLLLHSDPIFSPKLTCLTYENRINIFSYESNKITSIFLTIGSNVYKYQLLFNTQRFREHLSNYI
jgi:hypothetical protein